jgi:hypothetical protein
VSQGYVNLSFHSDVSVLYLAMQYHRRLFIINQKLAHMNEQNFINLGAWWAQKMSRAQEKLTAAVKVLLNLALEEPLLRNQWGAQCHAVTKQNPGMLALQCTSHMNAIKQLQYIRSLKGCSKATHQ